MHGEDSRKRSPSNAGDQIDLFVNGYERDAEPVNAKNFPT
jgi:hypothetical protein